ncbi:cysteine proteinase [Obba rivulosa]|uniref:ubiquitinyl hydrolase 1 n=1 Tax=Obba rivulosa TaxID=1052685 RepID=A0A8E2DRQ5_9APHY|nr:cysteine proteinase [Obba rivulosa]
MVLETLSLVLPWNWFDTHSSQSSSHEKRKLKKKVVRTRAEQLVLDTFRAEGVADDGYYPGLVNLSGTYCFMNSTLQAMASLNYLQPYIDRIHRKAEALDVPTPVVDALRELMHALNTPGSYPHPIRPLKIIETLSNRSQAKHNSLFSSREHQDAQELFQLLSECIKNEAVAVDKEGLRDRGLGGLSPPQGEENRGVGKSVFDGLTANRRSCVECGYTEAVMHFAFDNWQLAVPRLASACRLEDCLADYTRLEILTDCICRKCSMIATCQKLEQEAERLTESTQAEHDPSASKKKKAREARKLASRVKAALEEGRIEEEIKGVKMEKVFSRASTKQAMIARPPPVLALHLNRSMHYGHYAAKNTCRVLFPELLDLTPYTTSGQLSTHPSMPISSPPSALQPVPARSPTPTPAGCAAPRTLYRLAAVVCHYGQHSFGHYVCFRRRPRAPAAPRRFAPPRLAPGLAFDDAPRPGRGWLRVSDDAVREVGLEAVLQEGAGAFMLYYERVEQPPAPAPAPAVPRPVHPSNSPRSSEETVRPDAHARGERAEQAAPREAQAQARTQMQGQSSSSPLPVRVGPRVVRSVATRSRSTSISPPQRAPALAAPPPASAPASVSRASAKSAPNGDVAKGGARPQLNGEARHSREPSRELASPPPSPTSSRSPRSPSRTSSSPPSARLTKKSRPPNARSTSSPQPAPPPSRTVDLRA